MSEAKKEEVVNEKITVQDVGKWAKWYSAQKHWVNPLVAAIVVYFGGNPDNVKKWIPDLSGLGGDNTEVVQRVDKLEGTVNVLAKAVEAHEKKLFPQGESLNVGESSQGSGDKVYRE